MAGTLYVVATPIGNLEDITVRALRILREVAVIAAEDTRRTAHLLTRYAITTPTTSLHEHNEHQKSSALIGRLQAGESIALVSDAGTPTVADPGVHLIGQAVEHGIRVEAIPGPNAAIAALSVSGLTTETFAFLGFPPTRSKDRNIWFERLRDIGMTAVFYEAPHRVLSTLMEIQAKLGDIPVIITRELTKAHEELVRGPISEIISLGLKVKGEFTIVIDIGRIPNQISHRPSSEHQGAAIAHDFGLLTAQRARTRRQAIALLARKYGVSARDAYKAIEAAKLSGS